MKRKIVFTTFCLTLFVSIIGCIGERLDPKNPVIITMWHNYGGQMQSVMDELIDKFNSTIGRKKGIIISVTSISASKDIQEKLFMLAAGDPGAPEMPDIVTTYPKTALILCEQGLLAPLDEQFTTKELDAYLPQFVKEGRLSDGKLYVFPIAKSTEVLFVNQTLFDRFSAATGVQLGSLATFEGIAEAAVKYYEWTDSLTPNIVNDGKTFFVADSWFNIAQVGVAQLGGEFVFPDQLNVTLDLFKPIWDFSVLPALTGGYAVTDGYSSDLAKTGEIVCSIGSTAGILFYGDSITYPDNTTEAVTYSILPYPVFRGGKNIAIQRGGGMCVKRSSPKKEYAAALFLKWFTQPEQNMRFVYSTGYLPVTKEAFENNMKQEIYAAKTPNLQKLLEATTHMYEEYTFMIPPNYEQFDRLSKEYELRLKQLMLTGRKSVLQDNKAPSIVSEELYSAFINL
ncbi:MAG TPA: extracellular solute-binding protein [Firmicutes bacterium]|nr:extracellular solute-binding protein [Bacillota bacterium]